MVYVISGYILRVLVVIQSSVFYFYVTFGLLCISTGGRCRFTYAEAERETWEYSNYVRTLVWNCA